MTLDYRGGEISKRPLDERSIVIPAGTVLIEWAIPEINSSGKTGPLRSVEAALLECAAIVECWQQSEALWSGTKTLTIKIRDSKGIGHLYDPQNLPGLRAELDLAVSTR